MFQVGRLCTKIAGRDADKKCVIVDVLDNGYVMIDGETRRRKCNIVHLIPTAQQFDLSKNAPREDVKALFKKELEISLTDTKPKESKERPKQVRKGADKQSKKE